MKDIEKETLEAYRPPLTARETVNFCLGRLFREKKKTLEDEVVDGLYYEELIGALLLAQDDLAKLALVEIERDRLIQKVEEGEIEIDGQTCRRAQMNYDIYKE